MKLEKNIDAFSQLRAADDEDKASQDYNAYINKYTIQQGGINNIGELIMLGHYDGDELVIPDYQRPLVWTLEQKQRLILSILGGNTIGDFMFARHWENRGKENYRRLFNVVDGQQRLTTIKAFVEGEFELPCGKIFDELKYRDRANFILFSGFTAQVALEPTKEQELELYYTKNFAGTAHSSADLEKLLRVKSEA